MRRLPVAFAVTGALLLAAPAAASAQGATVQAQDGTPQNPNGNVWTPSQVTIKAGETGNTVIHNVASASSNWTFTSPYHPGTPSSPSTGTESYPFATPGVYEFVCQVHQDTMTGKVTVTDASGNPPPDPPDPPSETPWTNDTPPLGGFENGGGRDAERPVLRSLRIRNGGRGSRVGFRVNERARVTVRVGLYGIALKTRTVQVAEGREWVRIRGLRRGRYRVRVQAHDPAGNRSRTLARTVLLR